MSHALTIESVKLIDRNGQSVQTVFEDEDYTIEILTAATRAIKNVSVGYNIKNPAGTTVCGTSSAVQGFLNIEFEAGQKIASRFTFRSPLASGQYFLSVGVAEMLTPQDEIYNHIMHDFTHDALPFVAVSKNKFSGIVNLRSKLLSMKKITPSAS
jgi:hypothetical protein